MKKKKIISVLFFVLAIAILAIAGVIIINSNKKSNKVIKKITCERIVLNGNVFIPTDREYIEEQDESLGRFNSSEVIDMVFKNGKLNDYNRETVYEFTKEKGYKNMQLWLAKDSKVYDNYKTLTRTVRDKSQVIEYKKEFKGNIDKYIELYEKEKYICHDSSKLLNFTCSKIIEENDNYAIRIEKKMNYKLGVVMDMFTKKYFEFNSEVELNDANSEMFDECLNKSKNNNSVVCDMKKTNEEIETIEGYSVMKYVNKLIEDNYSCEIKKD